MTHFNTVLLGYGKTGFLSKQDFLNRSATSIKEMLSRVGLGEEYIEEARSKFLAFTRQEPRPNLFYDAGETLRWLYSRFIGVYIVSAHPENDIISTLQKDALLHYVKEVRGGISAEGKVVFAKGLIEELGISKNELVFVDDSDIILELAKSIGCYRVASRRGYCSYERLLQAGPDKIIRDLESLQRYINLIHFTAEKSTEMDNRAKEFTAKLQKKEVKP